LRLRLTGNSPRLRALLTRPRPRLLHAHFGGDGWLISASAAELGLPLIVTVHGHVTRQPDLPGLPGLRGLRHLRTVFDRAAVILPSASTSATRPCGTAPTPPNYASTTPASGSRLPRSPPCLLPPPRTSRPRPPRLRPLPSRPLPSRPLPSRPLPSRPLPFPASSFPDFSAAASSSPTGAGPLWDVAFVGRFVAKKGVEDLIAALARLDRPRALLIGSGPLEGKIRAYAADRGVDATFLGAREPAAVARELARTRVFVAPSKTAPDGDAEGLPTTILEAAALGVPTVSTRHSGIPEAVLDGTTGLLGPEGDADALASNIDRLLADDAFRRQLGAQARAHVSAHFDLRRQSEILERLYDEVAG
jgi:colanic acid/amylovoran biosynthesis glycosyltransferase